MADLGQGHADPEPTERMGCRQTRCAGGRGAVLDSRFPGGAEGAFCTVRPLFLDGVEFLEEQGGGKEPAATFVTTRSGGETGGSERRLRPAGVREIDHPEDMGGARPPEGNTLSLPGPA